MGWKNRKIEILLLSGINLILFLEGEPICNMSGMYCLSKYKDELFSLTNQKDGKTICPCLNGCDASIYSETIIRNEVFPWKTAMQFKFLFPRVTYVRSVIFSSIDLIVQIGGIFSLFLGCSILSLIEIAYFISLRLFWAMQKKYCMEVED